MKKVRAICLHLFCYTCRHIAYDFYHTKSLIIDNFYDQCALSLLFGRVKVNSLPTPSVLITLIFSP